MVDQMMRLEQHLIFEPRVIGRAGISADMSLRLSDALGAHAAFWSGMQMEYELWHASRKARPKILPFHRAS